jgi:hypothetical protein
MERKLEMAEQFFSDKIYLFGFMPLGEAGGVLAGDLSLKLKVKEIRKWWLPKTAAASLLANTDPYIIDDGNIGSIIKDLGSENQDKLQEIESHLNANPFFQVTPHTIKLVEIDKLIALQSHINVERVKGFAKLVKKDSTISELLDFCLVPRKTNSKIEVSLVAQNSYMFCSDDEDIRLANPEIQELPKFDDPISKENCPALVLKVICGDPFIYVIKTYSQMPTQFGMVKHYQLTLQNGFHRAYLLRSLGFTHMPCIVIEPVSSNETQLLTGNWPPEKLQQTTMLRPPLLKDFFNHDVSETVKVRKRKTCWKISWVAERIMSPT